MMFIYRKKKLYQTRMYIFLTKRCVGDTDKASCFAESHEFSWYFNTDTIFLLVLLLYFLSHFLYVKDW